MFDNFVALALKRLILTLNNVQTMFSAVTSVLRTGIVSTLLHTGLTSYTPKLPSYRKQSSDFLCKSTDWFLYDGNFGA